jgi:hypothetical protein
MANFQNCAYNKVQQQMHGCYNGLRTDCGSIAKAKSNKLTVDSKFKMFGGMSHCLPMSSKNFRTGGAIDQLSVAHTLIGETT